MDIDEIIEGLKKQLNLYDLKINNDGVARLVFDERMTVDIEADDTNGHVRLYSVIASLAQEPSAAFYKEILSSNVSGLQGELNRFGIDADSREIVLFCTIDITPIDIEGFTKYLEAFVNDFEHWLDKYETGDIGEADQVIEQSMFNDISNNANSLSLRL
jgi:hypothetical protein